MSKMSDLAIEKMQEAVDKGEYIPEPYEPDEEEYLRIMQSDEYLKEHLEQSLKVAQAGVEEEVFLYTCSNDTDWKWVKK